jgi:hypothetical protein
MTRKEQIEAAAKEAYPHAQALVHETFIDGAVWADQNNSWSCGECVLKEVDLEQAKEDLAIAVLAIIRIGIAQMGSLDYTEDFFELTKNIIRDTLKRLT